MRTIVMIAQEILAAVREQGAAIQALIIVSSQDSMAANEEIKARLQRIEEAVTTPGTSPDQATVDALTAQASAAAAGLNQSTGGLEAAITQETQTP